MKRRVSFLALLISVFALAGCNAQVENWVKSAAPDLPEVSLPSQSAASPMSLKMTPGHLQGAATGMSIEGTVTPTNQRFQLGSDASISLTLSRTRVSPQ